MAFYPYLSPERMGVLLALGADAVWLFWKLCLEADESGYLIDISIRNELFGFSPKLLRKHLDLLICDNFIKKNIHKGLKSVISISQDAPNLVPPSLAGIDVNLMKSLTQDAPNAKNDAQDALLDALKNGSWSLAGIRFDGIENQKKDALLDAPEYVFMFTILVIYYYIVMFMEWIQSSKYNQLTITHKPLSKGNAGENTMSREIFEEFDPDKCWEKFWAVYPIKRGKADTKKIFFNKQHYKFIREILVDLEIRTNPQQLKPWIRGMGYIKHPSAYLNEQLYLDEDKGETLDEKREYDAKFAHRPATAGERNAALWDSLGAGIRAYGSPEVQPPSQSIEEHFK